MSTMTKPTLAAAGAALLMSLGSASAVAADNPFAAQPLSGGYAQLAEAKCGEAKCGGDTRPKAEQEGKCGAAPSAKADREGSCGADKPAKADQEGKCGEAKCGASQ